MNIDNLIQISETEWEIPTYIRSDMRVPVKLFATRELFEQIINDKSLEQAINAATLPGLVGHVIVMPDMHQGYGFPIGGVAAFDPRDGVISPGGVGYDINWGVRLLASKLTRAEIQPKLKPLVDELFRRVPTGVGSGGAVHLSVEQLKQAAAEGAHWAIQNNFGTETDLEYIEENGCVAGADIGKVSERAWVRGQEQLGTLGSGNHFLEIGYVAEIYDEEAARVLGLALEQVTAIIHCGSRGFGYQVCEDYLSVMDKASRKHQIALPDRQLACAPIESEAGQNYLGAMNCAINYAFANRQIIAHNARVAFEKALGLSRQDIGLRTVYEVAHNIAKFEAHRVQGELRKVCVHRKGATRAFAPGSRGIPSAYQAIGQPVLIPGDMGRYSYVLTGTERAMDETFGSTCHGAGRALSRMKAKAAARGRDIVAEMASRGIVVRGQSRRTVDEEISEAYKDVSNVVDACALAGISNKVAQLKPLGCIKG